ncbi:TIGR03503 family protein [Shewanella halotolerans]|uniref:TIGR03503 family protein n=1 Tax=Shewanella halotolerans TaxID=2864204 RepID=UPI001C65F65F|nr:TIGR03503 family protein [Shewanella halotolerans]QYJ91705.1 TIGR03503 family protein [Shewanella halotolerans]
MRNWLLRAIFTSGLLLLTLNATAQVVPSSQASELKNRFRIDHMVDELTLFVQRDYGSAPVIIVLPDGSKWYVSRHPESVQWVDGLSGDIITIKSPMPGPWQLLGKVAKGSKIDKVSKLGIEVDPMPQPLYQGERIKITAKLLGDEQRMRMPGLDYLVDWTAKFISEHRPGDENFAAGTLIVGSYKDNGEGLDGAPDDGIFTADINLNQPWGHYRFLVSAKNNTFSREVGGDIVLLPMPVSLSVIAPEDHLKGRWQVEVIVDDEQLQLANTHFEFELVGPAGLQLTLPVQSVTDKRMQLTLPQVSEFGSYRIKGIAAATSVSGREVLLTLPEKFFNLVPPPEPPPTAEELAAIAAKKAAIAEAKAKDDAMFWIITVNITLLIIGTLALLVWRKRQNLKQALAVTAARLEEQRAKEIGPTLDEIDLTMPEEGELKGVEPDKS